MTKARFSYQIKQTLIFFLGFFLTTLLIILIMKWLGHLEIYIDNLKIVCGMGLNSDGQNNIYKLAKSFFYTYSESVILAILTINLIFIFYLIGTLSYVRRLLSRKYVISGLIFLGFLVFTVLLLKGKLSYRNVQMLFIGTSLLSTISIMIAYSNKELKLLAVLGSLIILFAPLGSEGGVFMAGRYALWIVLPITIDFLIGINDFRGTIILASTRSKRIMTRLTLKNNTLRKIRTYGIVFIVLTGFYYSYFYPYFDLSVRSKMFYQVENNLVKGIFTTKERATVINELLIESKKYIDKNDIILAYDCIPMVYFITQTRPYMRNPWPGYYYPEAFQNEIDIAQSKSTDLPVIITQQLNTLASNWPQNKDLKYVRSNQDLIRDSIMTIFLNNNKYSKVWENDVFEILLPDAGAKKKSFR